MMHLCIILCTYWTPLRVYEGKRSSQQHILLEESIGVDWGAVRPSARVPQYLRNAHAFISFYPISHQKNLFGFALQYF